MLIRTRFYLTRQFKLMVPYFLQSSSTLPQLLNIQSNPSITRQQNQMEQLVLNQKLKLENPQSLQIFKKILQTWSWSQRFSLYSKIGNKQILQQAHQIYEQELQKELETQELTELSNLVKICMNLLQSKKIYKIESRSEGAINFMKKVVKDKNIFIPYDCILTLLSNQQMKNDQDFADYADILVHRLHFFKRRGAFESFDKKQRQSFAYIAGNLDRFQKLSEETKMLADQLIVYFIDNFIESIKKGEKATIIQYKIYIKILALSDLVHQEKLFTIQNYLLNSGLLKTASTSDLFTLLYYIRRGLIKHVWIDEEEFIQSEKLKRQKPLIHQLLKILELHFDSFNKKDKIWFVFELVTKELAQNSKLYLSGELNNFIVSITQQIYCLNKEDLYYLAVILTSSFVQKNLKIPHYNSNLWRILDKLERIPEYKDNMPKMRLKIQKSLKKAHSWPSF